MPKAFLSHSSKDKGYVRTVADHLGGQRAIFDERSFEVGLPTFEEISRGLAETDLFVLFISDSALRSEWVPRELDAAHKLLGRGKLARLFPIIVDQRVTYMDHRLPEWMRQEYNLKFVSRPTVAARRIEQQLRRLSWEAHPKLRERQRIFVGRNELIRGFEQRTDSLDEPTVNCILASGIPGIGRRALMRHCLAKANLVTEAYESPVIALSDGESIEDFLQRVYDLGFTEHADLSALLTRTIPAKVVAGVKLLEDVVAAKEVILVVDGGAIAAPDGELSAWFRLVAEGMAKFDRPVLGIASRYRVSKQKLRGLPHVFAMEVSELSAPERSGLLKRYADWSGLALPASELQFIAGLLSGLPEQVLYAVDMAREEGVARLHRESFRIVDFSSQRISNLMAALDSDPEAVAFLRLLAEFEFVSEVLLLAIAGDNEKARSVFDRFAAMAVCEYIGATGEYLRLNEAVRDYVTRTYTLRADLREKLERHLRRNLQDVPTENMDVADLLATLKAALLRGEQIASDLLIPSHFLKAIKELYDARENNRGVVALAERALSNAAHLDERIVREIRVYMCLALARQRDPRFFEEVREFRRLPKAEYEFLHGFYYRQTGNLVRAVESLKAALEDRPGMQRARNELARIFLQLEAWDLAAPLAREANRASPDNTYFLRTLFESLVRAPVEGAGNAEVKQLQEKVGRLTVKMADEMYLNARAQYAAYRDRDLREAERLLEEAMRVAGDPTYHLLTLCEVAKDFRDGKVMRATLHRLRDRARSANSAYGTRILRLEVLYRALSGDVVGARTAAPSLAKRLPDEVRARLEGEIRQLSEEGARDA
jgi:tetratricopeptide (TPR) repeat protein